MDWFEIVMGLLGGLVDALGRTFTLAKRIARIEAPRAIVKGEAV